MKLLNFLLTLVGLAMVGYGVYMFIMYTNAAKGDFEPPNGESVKLGRPMLMAVALSSSSIFDNLPTAWYVLNLDIIIFMLFSGSKNFLYCILLVSVIVIGFYVL